MTITYNFICFYSLEYTYRTMTELRKKLFLFVLSVFRFSNCIVKNSKFKRHSSESAGFVHPTSVIEGISLLQCSVRGLNEDVAFSYQKQSRRCELAEKTGWCFEYEPGDNGGWQTYRSCDTASEGMYLKRIRVKKF